MHKSRSFLLLLFIIFLPYYFYTCASVSILPTNSIAPCRGDEFLFDDYDPTHHLMVDYNWLFTIVLHWPTCRPHSLTHSLIDGCAHSLLLGASPSNFILFLLELELEYKHLLITRSCSIIVCYTSIVDVQVSYRMPWMHQARVIFNGSNGEILSQSEWSMYCLYLTHHQSHHLANLIS